MPRHFVRPLPSAPALPLDLGSATLALEDELACLLGIVITHPLIEVKSSVKSGTWRRVGSKPVQWVFGVRSVTFQKKRSKLLREWPHDWHCADNYFHRCSASTLV